LNNRDQEEIHQRLDEIDSRLLRLAESVKGHAHIVGQGDGLRRIFPLQRTAERYNAAAAAMTVAAKRLNELDDERRQMAQSQQEGWQQFVKGK
jgi:hypothetical protein